MQTIDRPPSAYTPGPSRRVSAAEIQATDELLAPKQARLEAHQEADLAHRVQAGLVARAMLAGDQPKAATRARLRRIVADADRAHDQLLCSNLLLVSHVAQRFRRHAELDELVAAGMVGLLRAVRRFDPGRGMRFATYAVRPILREVSRAVARHAGPVALPREVNDLRGRALRVQEELTNLLGRPPSDEELAAELGTTPSSLDRARTRVVTTPLHGPPTDDHAATEMQLPDRLPTPEQLLVRADEQRAVQRMLDGLAPTDVELLRRRFGLAGSPACTLEQLAEEYGVPAVEIAHREAALLDRLAPTPPPAPDDARAGGAT